MNDISKDTAKTAVKSDKTATITCNLHNPTPARRVIYDGIGVEGAQGQGPVQRTIVVEPGETKIGVTLSRVIAEELRDRNRAKKNSDLQIKPLTADAEEEAA